MSADEDRRTLELDPRGHKTIVLSDDKPATAQDEKDSKR